MTEAGRLEILLAVARISGDEADHSFADERVTGAIALDDARSACKIVPVFVTWSGD